jgi:hypothetical protein
MLNDFLLKIFFDYEDNSAYGYIAVVLSDKRSSGEKRAGDSSGVAGA